MKTIYVIRHCQAEGQEADAKLTELGEQQAIELAAFFKEVSVERILSSPYSRAVETIQPIAEQKKIPIVMDDRLKERVLSTSHLPDWMEKLEATFHDGTLKYDNGESSDEAIERIQSVVDEVLESEANVILLVTHGNLMSLLLREYIQDFGFHEWQQLSNPDVYVLEVNMDEKICRRVWKEQMGKD